MNLSDALQILEFDALPTAEALEKRYKKLVFKYHPDHGGDHDDFVVLQEAHSILTAHINGKATDFQAQHEAARERAEAARKAAFRKHRMKVKAEESARESEQLSRAIIFIILILIGVAVYNIGRPMYRNYKIEQNPLQAMCAVTSVYPDYYTITWTFGIDGVEQTRVEDVRGTTIFVPDSDGNEVPYIITPNGLLVHRGMQMLVRFNPEAPQHYEVQDAFIHPESAQSFFAMAQPTMSQTLGIPYGDPALECIYWSMLDAMGTEAIGHFLWADVSRMKSWTYNAKSFQKMQDTEVFKNTIKACVQQ